jgi:hypothetical protein
MSSPCAPRDEACNERGDERPRSSHCQLTTCRKSFVVSFSKVAAKLPGSRGHKRWGFHPQVVGNADVELKAASESSHPIWVVGCRCFRCGCVGGSGQWCRGGPRRQHGFDAGGSYGSGCRGGPCPRGGATNGGGESDCQYGDACGRGVGCSPGSGSDGGSDSPRGGGRDTPWCSGGCGGRPVGLRLGGLCLQSVGNWSGTPTAKPGVRAPAGSTTTSTYCGLVMSIA